VLSENIGTYSKIKLNARVMGLLHWGVHKLNK